MPRKEGSQVGSGIGQRGRFGPARCPYSAAGLLVKARQHCFRSSQRPARGGRWPGSGVSGVSSVSSLVSRWRAGCFAAQPNGGRVRSASGPPMSGRFRAGQRPHRRPARDQRPALTGSDRPSYRSPGPAAEHAAATQRYTAARCRYTVFCCTTRSCCWATSSWSSWSQKLARGVTSASANFCRNRCSRSPVGRGGWGCQVC